MRRTTFNFRNYRYFQKVSYRTSNKRWLALLLSIFVIFGSEYCFDVPQAMETKLEEKLQIDTVTFNLLYTVYSLPNLILPLFGGIFVDILGVRAGLLVFSFTIIIGQIICAIGGYFSYFWVIVAGRVMFGIGAESLFIAQNSIVSLWFQNKDLAFALALNLSYPHMASGVNSIVTPRVLEYFDDNLFAPFAVGGCICFVSWICAFILVYMDKESDKREGKLKKEVAETPENKAAVSIQHKESAFSQSSGSQVSSDRNASCTEKSEKGVLFSPEKENKLIKSSSDQALKEENQEQEPEEERVRWADIKKLKASFWIIALLCAFSEGLYVPFLDNSNKFYQKRFHFTIKSAGNVLLIPYFFLALTSPLLGYLIDKIGRRRIFIFVTGIAFLSTHILFALLPDCESECYVTVIPLFMLSLAFCLYNSSMVASVPLVVDNKILGTAFGLIVIFQNATLAKFPLIVGAIFEDFNEEIPEIKGEREGFRFSSYFFIGISVLTIFLAFALLLFDKTMNKALDEGNLNNQEAFLKFEERSKKQFTFKESLAAHLMDIKEDEEFEDMEILNKLEWKHSPSLREALGLERSEIFPLYSSLKEKTGTADK